MSDTDSRGMHVNVGSCLGPDLSRNWSFLVTGDREVSNFGVSAIEYPRCT